MTVASDRTINNSLDVARKIPGSAIEDDAITAEKIAAGAVTAGDVADGSVTTAKLAAGALAASATGRAKMADGFFTEAAATAKFAAQAITGALIKAGAIAADATGRALMATGLFNEATVDDKFANGAVNGGKLKGGTVSGAKLTATAIKIIGFTGVNGAGAATLTGAAVGDRVLGIVETTATDAAAAAKFEATVSVLNQIQQTDVGDLSTKRYFAVLVAASA